MRREAGSGRRIDAPGSRVRVIDRVGGFRLWNAHLRVWRDGGQPVVELRQRPWTALPMPTLYAAVSVAFGLTLPDAASRRFSLFAATVIAASGVYGSLARRSWIRVGPQGVTMRSAWNRTPTSFAWNEIAMVQMSTEAWPREFLTRCKVTTRDGSGDRSIVVNRPWSVSRMYLLSLVVLATCHRYGASGLYLGETSGSGWKAFRDWGLPTRRDERYLLPRAPRSAVEPFR
jgi:hypothetical protein